MKDITSQATQSQAPEVTVSSMVTQSAAENVTQSVAHEVTVGNKEVHEVQQSPYNDARSSTSFSMPLQNISEETVRP